MSSSFKAEIENLLRSKREGPFWDFKQIHHDNKAELLHDILCLANVLHKGNRFLIYGISDPKEGCQIIGVENNSKRRSQADIIDFLRSRPFSGDIRPEIELKTIEIEEKNIDVLVIFNHNQKPYYLREDYRDRDRLIKANSIYTRNVDTNTPIDSSADMWVVEKMWRERFGLDTQPGERMENFLMEPQNWDKNIGNRKWAYHKFSPEYQIEFGDTREFSEAFTYFYPNPKAFVGEARFKYLSTTLFTLTYMYCDEMRIVLAYPQTGFIHVGGKQIWYMYYTLESRDGIFLNFLTNGDFDFKSRGSDNVFLMFRDENEREDFEHYLISNIEKLDEIEDAGPGCLAKDRMERDGNHSVFDPVEMCKIQRLFNLWKFQKTLKDNMPIT